MHGTHLKTSTNLIIKGEFSKYKGEINLGSMYIIMFNYHCWMHMYSKILNKLYLTGLHFINI